jgi:hypothetical protein
VANVTTIDVLTGLLVLITGFYAWATFRILRANEKVVTVMNKQSDALTRPYIDIRSFIIPDNITIFLEIKNSGKTAANNLRLELDRDFYQWGEKKDDSNLANLTAFKQVIQCFPPNTVLTFYLGHGPSLFGERSDPTTTPRVFSIRASYSYADKVVQETTTIDLNKYLNTALPPDATVSELKKIREEIGKLDNTIQKLEGKL